VFNNFNGIDIAWIKRGKQVSSRPDPVIVVFLNVVGKGVVLSEGNPVQINHWLLIINVFRIEHRCRQPADDHTLRGAWLTCIFLNREPGDTSFQKLLDRYERCDLRCSNDE